MTLPPNCLPPENAASSGDLLAVLGQPASTPADGQPAAPFADLLAGVAPAVVTCTPPPLILIAPPAETASQPVVNPLPAMYSSYCYTTLLQPATLEEAPASPDKPVAEIVSPDVAPAKEDEGALLLAYQLIAGQWVPQPVNPPAQPAKLQESAVAPASLAVAEENPAQVTSIGRCAGFAQQQSEVTTARRIAGKEVTPDKNAFSKTVATRDDAEPFAATSKTVVTRDDAEPFATTSKTVAATAVGEVRRPQQPEAKTPVTSATTVPLAGFDEVKSPVASTITNTSKLELPAAPKSENTTLNIASASEIAPTNIAENSTPLASPAQPFRPANMTSVKFAAPGSEAPAETAPGGNPLSREQEKKTLVADIKGVKPTGRQIGTSAANRDYSMPYSAANKISAPSDTALPQSPQTGGMQNGTTAPVAETSSASSVQAPRLVQEIRAIADRISTIDRNTVEVRFDFNESDRLSVRVEYRDGTVHTTFRTNSEPLREAIAREWQVQAVTAGPAEPRSYRVAEPVFSSNQVAASTDLSQSGLGSG